MAIPYAPGLVRFKLDENIMDLWSLFNEGGIVFSDTDHVELEGIRGAPDHIVLREADKHDRTVLTNDTDCLLNHWSAQSGVILLWGRLGTTRFIRLKRPLRATVVRNLFDTHRQEIDDIYRNKRAMMAILSGTEDAIVWILRAPTPEEMIVFFVKFVGKEKLLPFQEETLLP